jgi:ABC-type sugar transport system substrate-binding protein
VLLATIASFIAAALLVALIAMLSGPIGAALSKKRDDFKRLPSLLARMEAGKRRGATVIRVSDDDWREAVRRGLAAVDVAIIDLSSVTEHIAWEIARAVDAVGGAIVFIRKDDGAGLAPEALAAVRAALGREPDAIVTYPVSRRSEKRAAKAFRRALAEAIYGAYEVAQARAGHAARP